MPTNLSIENLIILANYTVLPQWILMIFLPRWKWTQKLMESYLIPFLLGVIYFYFFILMLPKLRGGYSLITFIRLLLSGQKAFLVLWFHIIIFDLVVGVYVVQDAIKKGMAWWARILSLILIFLTGPIGFLIYQWIFKQKSSSKNS